MVPEENERSMTDDLTQAVERAAQLVAAADYVVALVGAGLSAESGIPTFRGPGGLWTRFGEPSMDGYQRFLADPRTYWREQREREQATSGSGPEMRAAIESARPNPGHHALAALEREGVLRYTITQNIDNLHYEAGQERVVEIHGNRHKLRCVECGFRVGRADFSTEDEVPRCPECAGPIKGDGVMFGEPIPARWLQTCYEQTDRCDLMLLVGTSGTVYPAAAFPDMVKGRGGTLIEANPLESHLSGRSDVVLKASAATSLPLMAARVRELRDGGAVS